MMSDFIARKKGKLGTSHRYDLLPLLHSCPGGMWRELVVYDFPRRKDTEYLFNCKYQKSDIRETGATSREVRSPAR